MTDYKNELEQFDHLWAMGAGYKEMKAFIEALLSQHSKKRELEARVDELKRISGYHAHENHKSQNDYIKFAKVDRFITDRIKKLTNGEDK